MNARRLLVEAVGSELVLVDHLGYVPDLDHARAITCVLRVHSRLDRRLASAVLEGAQFVFLGIQTSDTRVVRSIYDAHESVLVLEHRAHLFRHVLGLVCGNLFQELGPGSDETIMIICFEVPQLRKKAGDHVEGLLGELFIGRIETMDRICVSL